MFSFGPRKLVWKSCHAWAICLFFAMLWNSFAILTFYLHFILRFWVGFSATFDNEKPMLTCAFCPSLVMQMITSSLKVGCLGNWHYRYELSRRNLQPKDKTLLSQFNTSMFWLFLNWSIQIFVYMRWSPWPSNLDILTHELSKPHSEPKRKNKNWELSRLKSILKKHSDCSYFIDTYRYLLAKPCERWMETFFLHFQSLWWIFF